MHQRHIRFRKKSDRDFEPSLRTFQHGNAFSLGYYLQGSCIQEFNLEQETRKLAPINMLQYTLPHAAPWQEQMYVMHDFTHPLYCTNLTEKTESHTQRPL